MAGLDPAIHHRAIRRGRGDDGSLKPGNNRMAPTPFSLDDLARIVAERAGTGADRSYTAQLLADGPARAAKKLGEEAVEAAIAAATGDRDRLRSEAADLLYHLTVLLHVSGVPFPDVMAELQRRTSETGLQERARRNGSG